MKRFLTLLILLPLLIIGCNRNTNEIKKASSNLSEYNFDIVYNDTNKTLDITQNINLVNPTETLLNELYFHIYPAAFCENVDNSPVGVLSKSKAYPNGVSYGNFDITSVKENNVDKEIILDGKDDDFLKIELETPLDIDERVKIGFTYSLKLPNINHRYGYGNNTINIANFYPILCVYENGWILDPYNSNGDPFYSYLANYSVNLSAPSNLKLATSGEIYSTTSKEDNSTYKIIALAVRDFAFVLSDKFEILEQNINGTKVMYFYYDESNPEEFLQTSVDALTTFNNIFGKYPYSTLSVVKSNFVHGGMEYPNLVLISDETTEKNDYINIIVHEIAHQWWYGLVGNNEYKDAWLDEGLTEYSTNLFYRANPQYDIDADEIIKNTTSSFVTFVDVYTSVLGSVDTSMNRALNEYNTEPEYVYVTYVKGMLFFNELKNLLGEEKFFKCLQYYFETYKFKNVTPEHLLSAFEKISKTDLQGFFNSWIEGKVVIK